MNIWKNTKTIDEYISDLLPAVSPRMAEIALIGGKKINIDDFPELKGIFKCGVGTDNIPFEEAEKTCPFLSNCFNPSSSLPL